MSDTHSGEEQQQGKIPYELNVTRSYGTKRIYGTVYPQDLVGIGFNMRWGGLYISVTEK